MLTPFMQRLRESIMPLHDEAEKVGPLHVIPDKTIRHEDYIKVLERLYGFVSVAEKVINRKSMIDVLRWTILIERESST